MFRHFRPHLLTWFIAIALLAGPALRLHAQAAAPSASESAESHLGKGYDALKKDRYDVAVDEFRAALRLDPRLVLRARFPLGVALFELHRSDEARREFETVARETGDHPNVYYYLGRLDLEDGHFDDAIRHLNLALSKPPFPDTTYYLGFAYFKKGNLASAEKWLKEAVRINPQDARMRYQLGQVYRKEGKESEAAAALAQSEQLRRRDSEQSQLRTECAQKLEQASRDEAKAVCQKLYDPDDVDKLTELGTLYAQHGDLESALPILQRAAELAPQSPQTRYNLGMAYFQLGRFVEARATLADAVTRWPDLFEMNALYGAVLFRLGDVVAAYPVLQHAHQLNLEDAATGDLLYLSALGVAREHQGARQYPEAVKYFEEAAKLKPQEPAPHRGLADVYNATGHPTKAAAEQKEAQRLASLAGSPQN